MYWGGRGCVSSRRGVGMYLGKSKVFSMAIE